MMKLRLLNRYSISELLINVLNDHVRIIAYSNSILHNFETVPLS
jgi:hypothetical protein